MPNGKKSQTSGIAIRLQRCSKTFDDGTRALEPLDLELAAGETAVVLGPSGCGKTTTLRLIAGLETPDPGGRIFLGEEDVTDVPIEKRNVGMVFQSYALFPNMNVEQNIAYGLRVRRMPRSERARRVNEMLSMMRIETLRSRHIDQLSGGQRQRVALARAIAVRPRVLLLDEPLTALDAKMRDALRVEIDKLLRSLHITALYVTHDQSEAMALGDRIVVMDHGRVAQVGTPREIYFRPSCRFVAEFVGSINRMKGKVKGGRLLLPGGSVDISATGFPETRNGDEIEVFFRPEHARVATEGEGHFTATVMTSFFMGNRTRLELAMDGASRLTMETEGNRTIRQGERVRLELDTSALFTLNQ